MLVITMILYKYKDRLYFLYKNSVREWVGVTSETDGGVKPIGLSSSEKKTIKDLLVYFK